MIKKTPAFFLDRDGVIFKEVGHLHRLDQVELLPKVGEAIALLNQNGFLTIVVTNQPVVARGMATEEEVVAIHDELRKKLEPSKAKLDGIYYCPHHPEGQVEKYAIACKCRKPAIGMITKANADFSIDMEKSYMVGDMLSDILMGKRAGLKTIRVLSGHSEDHIIKTSNPLDEEEMKNAKPDHLFADLYEAVKNILKL